ncbi:hypothetical protein, partial [Thiolapillus sp.]|uniref:hypothetical protein n=1 Tax=Thiolapillus sp. TaxID=2017437 RepID=UPI003AF75554
MTRTAGAPMGCQRPSRFWGLGCPKIYHEAEDTLAVDQANPRFVSITTEIVTNCSCPHYWSRKKRSEAPVFAFL